jgi:hypothetical protein
VEMTLSLETITLEGFRGLGDSAGGKECRYVFVVAHACIFYPTTPNMLCFPKTQRMVHGRVVVRWNTTLEQTSEYGIGSAVTTIVANGSRKIVIRRLN